MNKRENTRKLELTTRIPSLRKRTLEKRRTIEIALSNLPKSFQDNPQAELLALFDVFLKEIDQYTSGKPIYERSFLQDVFRYYHQLKEEINRTRPVFQIVPDGNVQGIVVSDSIPVESHGLQTPPPNGTETSHSR